MTKLRPCAGCGRYIRTSEARCPFCGFRRRGGTPWVVAVGLGLSTLAYACACYGGTPCGPLECTDSAVATDASMATDADGSDAGTDAAPADAAAPGDAGDGG